MTPIELLERLDEIDCMARHLMRKIGYDGYAGPDRRSFPMPADPDGRFFWRSALDLLALFPGFHDDLTYLKGPVHATHTLCRLSGGRFGYRDASGQPHVFTCGTPLEFLYPDQWGCPSWHRTRIEHNGTDYFLWGAGHVDLNGLTIRERG